MEMWQNSKKITGLWTNNQDQNAWVWVDGLGWRKISLINYLGMLAVCLAAYNKNSFVNFNEVGVGGDIYIAEIYVT
jgi:hypothetical protein